MAKIKIMGIFCTTLVGLALTFYGVENIRGKTAWEDFKKKWEAKGEVFDYKQVVPKPVPPGENFANTPMLKPLLEQKWNADFTESKSVEKKQTQRANDLIALKGKGWPKLAQWSTGRSTDLAAWQKYFREQKDWPHPEKAGRAADDILFALKKHEADLAELTQAAKARPQCRFDIKYEATFAALLPHLSVLRNATRGYTLRALAHLANDNPDAALADVEMSLFLAECIRDEPLLISQLVRIAILKIALQPVWEGLANQKWNAAQLAALEKRLAKIDLLKGYRLAILGERDLGNLMIDRMRNQPAAEWAKLFGDDGLLKLPAGWIDQNKVRINEMHMEFTLPVVDAKARRIKPKIAAAFDRKFERPQRGPYNVLVNLLMPAIGRVAIKTGSAQSAVDHARLACLLEAHQIGKGKYPAKLAELKAPMPNDVYTGKPYLYRLEPKGGYLLYSVGWNEKDDGGKAILNPKSIHADEEQGDLVWRYSAVPGSEKK